MRSIRGQARGADSMTGQQLSQRHAPLHSMIARRTKRPSLPTVRAAAAHPDDTAPPAVAPRVLQSDSTSTSTSTSSSTSSSAAAAAAAAGITVYYNTSWRGGRLHGSLAGAQPWRDWPLERVTSAPGKWLRARVPLDGSSNGNGSGSSGSSGSGGAPLLEFVMTDGSGNWDKAAGGGNFAVPNAGVYTVRGGAVSRVSGPAVCVVSDLDGTMVGDDAATAAFKQWWEETGVVRGGLLVYNTGRSLESFKQLLHDKGHALARPDVLISAVGTKVYNYAGAGAWAEDAGWTAQLDEGWELGAVRDAAYAALAATGRERMHFRPPEEQNDHKVTCGVHVDALAGVLESVQAALDRAGVRANIITSGTGEWRFVDCVPLGAGKLQALEFVASSHGFGPASTVACGDSGNDILMLDGSNLAVAVGNSQPDLVAWLDARQAAEEGGPLPGKARLYRARASEARGILEALEYWGLA